MNNDEFKIAIKACLFNIYSLALCVSIDLDVNDETTESMNAIVNNLDSLKFLLELGGVL